MKMWNKRGMEMIQVAILVAIAVTIGLIFKEQCEILGAYYAFYRSIFDNAAYNACDFGIDCFDDDLLFGSGDTDKEARRGKKRNIQSL